MKTGQCVETLEGHSSYVNCLLLLPTGEVVSGSYDKTLKVWAVTEPNIKNSKEEKEFKETFPHCKTM